MAKKRKPAITVKKKDVGKGYDVNVGGRKRKGFRLKSTANAFAKELRDKRIVKKAKKKKRKTKK